MNLEVFSIITLDDVIQYLEEDESLGGHVSRILKYKSRYGVK